MRRGRKHFALIMSLLLAWGSMVWTAQPAQAADVNLAQGKTVTASGEDTQWGNVKEKAVDGDPGTQWSAPSAIPAGGTHWLQVDLGQAYSLAGTEITWKDADKNVKYKIEVSANGTDWTTAADRSNNETAATVAMDTFEQTGIRYVKVSISYYAGSGWWAGIKELKIRELVDGHAPSAITGYDPVALTTKVGIAPVLPAKVTARYANGTSGEVDVAWNSVNADQYAVSGSFTVAGTVEGASVQSSATVDVSWYRDDFVRGVDISTLTAIEDNGGRYFDENGTERDLLDILKDRGVNYVRLRQWNNPTKSDGYNDLDDVVRMAARVKAKGMKLLVDFHYSDDWAHPGQQVRPAAWKDYNFDQLKQAVYDYTFETLTELKKVNALPDMVQIGNEINSGVLTGLGGSVNFNEQVQLLNSGSEAVRKFETDGNKIQIMIHLAEGGQNGTFRNFFDGISGMTAGVTGKVDYDVIGLSYYPFWHGTLEAVQSNMDDISKRYDKDVIIAETSYPFSYKDGDAHGNIIDSDAKLVGGAIWPATVQGQYDAMKKMMELLASVPDDKGAGFFYWEPAWIPANVGWIASEGDAWENQSMFDYDSYPENGGYAYKGYALNSLDVYKVGMAQSPANRMELARVIAKAKALKAEDFTTASWPTLAPAIAAAEAVHAKANAATGLTQLEADSAAAALTSAIDSLDVILAVKTTLAAAIDEAEALNEADWTAQTWSVLSSALETAKKVFASVKSTQTDVNEATATLNAAIDQLSNVDKTALNALLANISKLSGSDYVGSTWQSLQTALTSAIAVQAKADATQAEVDAALSALEAAKTALLPLVDLTEAEGVVATSSSSAGSGGGQDNSPEGAIDVNPNTSWGTDQGVGSWWSVDLGKPALVKKVAMNLWSGMKKFKIEVSQDGETYTVAADTTNDVIDQSSVVLPANTMARYIKVTVTNGGDWVGFMDFSATGLFLTNKTALEAEIAKADALLQSAYTSDSWAKLATALQAAKSIATSQEVVQDQVDGAAAKLKTAMASLVAGQTSSGSVPVSVPAAPSVTVDGSHVKVTATGKPDAEGKVSVELGANNLPKAAEGDNKRIAIAIELPAGAKGAEVSLPADWMANLTQKEVKAVEVAIGDVRVSLAPSLLEAAPSLTGKPVELSVAQVNTETLTAEARSLVGDRPVYDFHLSVDGKKLEWKGSKIEVGMPYTLKTGERADQLAVYYVNEQGGVEAVRQVRYDEATSTLYFLPEHFSRYAAAYADLTFKDTAAHPWAQTAIAALAAKGIVQGVSAEAFQPSGQVTRAAFLHMLVQAMGSSAVGQPSKFSDVKDGQWYTASIAASEALGIAKGKPNGTFGVNDAITREEMAVLLHRAIQASGAKPAAGTATSFTDEANISSFAREAVTAVQALGLMNGTTGGKFTPQATATRAEAAVVIHRLMGMLYGE
ncbi:glycosyl hydrolase 53 family protein [Paenibacillus methanolicus]|uniref:Arabinogalactan endo-beta-1,4-galactanase n=1 Tax=Paenibacillus methanolicus TaxID=582686 RepID=A0A5S5CFM9_9BACL|nr:glycosyl hydrolase 53 family protein [Paenibacillus methanolicus]TYP78097.1 arabinogalactan endo-1,4-beta-galactosidase [Paenibacillus methanolicus]